MYVCFCAAFWRNKECRYVCVLDCVVVAMGSDAGKMPRIRKITFI